MSILDTAVAVLSMLGLILLGSLVGLFLLPGHIGRRMHGAMGGKSRG